ncbi:MAG: tetratricopeptide repeat protein [Methylacidiphilales bacterium]|nr:tetratricopeptide repeat protein [Candidatus Methylacidiphilales bacterium]
MKTLASLILAGSVLCLAMPAQAETLDDANRAFAAGHYHESTLGFQAVLAREGYSAPVLFDLGNSSYCEGDFAQAILAYKRAQWLSPNDPDIAANLQLAQKQAGLSVAEPSWMEKITRTLSASGWAWVGSGAWTLFCASLLARAILPQRRSLFFLTGAASVLVLFTAIAAGVISSGELRQAVVTDKNASALISPFPAAQTVFSPPPGETVTVQKAYNDFFLVKDAAGHTGWISKTQITPIVPSLSNG